MINDSTPYVHIHAFYIAKKIAGYSCCCADCNYCPGVNNEFTDCFFVYVYQSVVEAFKEIRKDFPVQD